MKLLALLLLLASATARLLEQCSSCDVVQLRNAALDCDVQQVNSLLENKAVGGVWSGRNALSIDESLVEVCSYSPCHDNTLLVRALLEQSTSQGVRSTRGLSPLEAAVFRKCTEIIDILAFHGVIGGLPDIDSAILLHLNCIPRVTLLRGRSREILLKLFELRLEQFYFHRLHSEASEVLERGIHTINEDVQFIFLLEGNESKWKFGKKEREGLIMLLIWVDILVATCCTRTVRRPIFIRVTLRTCAWIWRMCCLLCAPIDHFGVHAGLWFLARGNGPLSKLDEFVLRLTGLLNAEVQEQVLCCILRRKCETALQMCPREWLMGAFDTVARQDMYMLTDQQIVSHLIRARARLDHRNIVLDRPGLEHVRHEQGLSLAREFLFLLAERGGLPNIRSIPQSRYTREQRLQMSPMQEACTNRRLTKRLRKRQADRDTLIYRSISHQLGGDVAHLVQAFER